MNLFNLTTCRWGNLPAVLLLTLLVSSLHGAEKEREVMHWKFDTQPGEQLGKQDDKVVATAIDVEGDELASKYESSSRDGFAWQFHQIPEGRTGGLKAFLDFDVNTFLLEVSFQPNEASVPEFAQYLAGISNRVFIRITEANMLEAGILSLDDEWKQLSFPLAKIQPLNQWIDVAIRYDGKDFQLLVNGSVEDSMMVENFYIEQGAQFVVAACPWQPTDDHYVGIMGSIKFSLIEM